MQIYQKQTIGMTVNRPKERLTIKKYKYIFVIVLIVISILLIGPLQLKTKVMKLIYPKKYERFVELYAKQYNVNENLIYAIIKAESNFEPKAISKKGAKGLMQLMEKTAEEVAEELDKTIISENISDKLLEVDTNIELGTKYILILLEKYKYIELALVAYNAGSGTVDSWIEKGIIKKDGTDIENVPYKETNQYVRKILRDYKIYQNLY